MKYLLRLKDGTVQQVVLNTFSKFLVDVGPPPAENDPAIVHPDRVILCDDVEVPQHDLAR